MVLKIERMHQSEPPGGLLKTQISGSYLQRIGLLVLGWDPRIYISNKLSAAAEAAGPETTL